MLNFTFIVATSFWQHYSKLLTAVAAIAIACAIAVMLDHLLTRRGRRIAAAVVRGELTPEATTRLHFVQRLLSVVIILIGIAIALQQFDGVRSIANSLLASGAIAAAVIGFAARQTLANVVAGLMLALTQPVRVGDWVKFEDSYGVVEDVALNYTRLRTVDDQRIVIPNERLASGILVNDSLVSARIAVTVSIWLPPGTDSERAINVLSGEIDTSVAIAESSHEGVRLSVSGPPCRPDERALREADLRRICLRRLFEERLLTPA